MGSATGINDEQDRQELLQLREISRQLRRIYWVVSVTAGFFLLRMFLEGLGELFKHLR